MNKTVSGISQALQQIQSKNQQARTFVAQRILQEAGETGTVHTVLSHHERVGFRPGVMSALSNTDPTLAARIATYLGSYVGLTSQHPSMVAFHADGGKDSLHHLYLPVPIATAAEAVLAHGVSRFVSQPGATGTLLHIFDPGSTLDLSPLVSKHNGSLSSTAGTGYRIGTGQGSDADSRADYRRIIAAAERHSSGPSTGHSRY